MELFYLFLKQNNKFQNVTQFCVTHNQPIKVITTGILGVGGSGEDSDLVRTGSCDEAPAWLQCWDITF